MNELRQQISVILAGGFLVILLLFTVLLTAVLLSACRSPQSTVTTTQLHADNQLHTTAASLFSFNLADTISFFAFKGDCIAPYRFTDTTAANSPYPRCLVDPLPIARIVRHAASSATITDSTATKACAQVNQATTKEPNKSASVSRLRDIAICCFLVVMFLGLLGCSFAVITYMILKRT